MNDLKKRFIHELAEYLVRDQVEKSIELHMDRPDAKAWANLRNLTPLAGYPTVEEAEEKLTQWLIGEGN